MSRKQILFILLSFSKSGLYPSRTPQFPILLIAFSVLFIFYG